MLNETTGQTEQASQPVPRKDSGLIPSLNLRKSSPLGRVRRKSYLTKCVTCGNQHSKEAKACPNCGQPSRLRKKWVGALAALIVGSVVVLVFAIMAHEANKAADAAADAAAKSFEEMFGGR